MVPNLEEKEINTYIHVCHSWRNNIDSKKWWKEKLFLSSKVSMSSIPTMRMCLWCPIMKKREIITSIHVCHDWWITLSPKNTGKKSFFYQPKTSMSSILMWRICLWCPIMKKMSLICASMFVIIDRMTLIPKKY